MIVVADTSPLNYLLQIGHIDLLPALYESVLIPPAVRDELRHAMAPAVVRKWIANPPIWLEVREPSASLHHVPDELDLGEREAIELALDTEALFVVLDDSFARETAKMAGLPVIGTLAVLREASRRRLIDFNTALEQLQATNFRMTSNLLRRMKQDLPSR